MYLVATKFIAEMDIKTCNPATIAALLEIIDNDNEMGEIAEELSKYPDNLIAFAEVSLSMKSYAKWQLAVELGRLCAPRDRVEALLYAFAHDDYEYTRRRALGSLAEIGSPLVEELVASAWSSGQEYQRMMVLSSLYKIRSSQLEKYLDEAVLDGREHLVAHVERVRNGDVK